MIPNPLPVIEKGFSWSNALLVTLNLLVGGALVALIKNWPRLKELGIFQRKNDMDDLNRRIGVLESKVEVASNAAHAAEMKLVYAVSAVRLLAAKIRSDNPNDPTLLQAMELLSAAMSGGLHGWGEKLGDALAGMKGTEE